MNKLKRYAKEIISFFIILIIATNLMSYYKSLDLNKQKFDFSTVVLSNNTNFSFDKNKDFIVYFWGSWCPICKYQSPNIQELKSTYNVLSIAVDSGNNEEIEAYLKSKNLSFDFINDKNNILSKKFNVQAFPTTLVYDKDFNLLFSEVGFTSILSIKLKTWWLK